MLRNVSNYAMALIDTLDAFLQHQKTPLFQNAAKGWEYSTRIDRLFLSKKSPRRSDQYSKNKNIHSATLLLQNRHDFEILDSLLKKTLGDQNHAFTYIENFCLNFPQQSLMDSYFHSGLDNFYRDISSARKKIIIFGAGPVGLFLANCLKLRLPNVEIYIIDNRIMFPGLKTPYSRNWVTHIPNSIFKNNIDYRIHKLFYAAGDGNFIGGKLNFIEHLLLISNKNLSNKLIFDNVDVKKVANLANNVLFFDATGARINLSTKIKNSDIKSLQQRQLLVKMEHKALALGHKRHGIESQLDGDLYASCDTACEYIYPFMNGNIIKQVMLKITSIKAVYYDQILQFILKINQDNKFYIWPAHIQRKFNEILIFVNISEYNIELYNELFGSQTNVMSFLTNKDVRLIQKNDPRAIELLKFINGACGRDAENIMIEPPFEYCPYVRNIWNYEFFIGKQKIIPIGDSLFNGHPKVGNGLGTHFRIASLLAEKIQNLME